MKEFIELSVLKEFSFSPGPRYKEEGDFSGESFRKNILEPSFRKALSEHKVLRVNLDGTIGYATSFLEESFGGLARTFGNEVVLENIVIISNEEPYLINDVKEYIKDAEKALA